MYSILPIKQELKYKLLTMKNDGTKFKNRNPIEINIKQYRRMYFSAQAYACTVATTEGAQEWLYGAAHCHIHFDIDRLQGELLRNAHSV